MVPKIIKRGKYILCIIGNDKCFLGFAFVVFHQHTVGGLVDPPFLIFCVSAFIYLADKLVRISRGFIKITFISVVYLKEEAGHSGGIPASHGMINFTVVAN